MSESLRDSAERHFQKTLSLMQKGKPEEALKELEKAEEAAQEVEANEFSQCPDYKRTSNADIRCI